MARDEQFNEFFNRTEFACRGDDCCDHSAPVVPELIDALFRLRQLIGPCKINSGFRCFKHNRSGEFGSNDNSQHPLGRAADVASGGRDVQTMARAASMAGAKGVILYDWGIHVDVRTGRKYFKDKRTIA